MELDLPTLREEHRVRVSENRVLRRIFGPNSEEVAGGWRRLHNEELHNLYNSPRMIRVIKSRMVRWAEHVARMVDMRNTYSILVGNLNIGEKSEDRFRWEDNIKLQHRGIG
jgi:hypothetical protein